MRWPHRPRRSTLLRAALVAALIGLAAAVLQTPSGCPPAPDASASPGSVASPGSGPDGDADRDGGTGPSAPPAAATLPLPDGAVGVPIRLAEPAALAVVRPGSRVDLLAVPAGGPAAEADLLAPRALVLDVVGAGAVDGSSALYLALSPEQAHRAVGLPEGSRFAIVVRG
ncbi:flagellar biosynthesis protein FlgA [Micromonospora olivasterospora]|uniref:flagellar biosynthesis protein FlgA n=1 Tax=Micromonospora olivasterospora TaxID=1880 RepID=UPI001FEBA991|nr:flagellar biosynthesis protein FlgA [Micromonospora olivasterospora]